MVSDTRKNNWPEIGNDDVIDFLETSLDNKKIASTYIFQGPEGLGKFSIAKHFASLLILDKDINDIFGNDELSIESKTSGDLNILSKEEGKQNISVSQVRSFIASLNLSSFKNKYKVGIIKEADSLSLEASNALLKTLEEPAENVVVILLTSRGENLLKTISSRSQVINFYPVSSEEIYDYLLDKYKASRDKAKELSRLSLGRPALAVKMLEDDKYYNNIIEQAKLFFSFMEISVNDRIIAFEKYFGKKESGQALKEKSLELLDNWALALRDCIFLSNNQSDLISFETLKDDIVSIEDNIAVNIFKQIQLARKYLKANVNANSVFSEFLINI